MVLTTTHRFAVASQRLDVGYLSYCTELQSPVHCSELFLIGEHDIIGSEPARPYRYVEIGNVDSFGRASPSLVDDEDGQLPDERSKEIERLRKKVKEGKAMRVSSWRALIPKTRPYLGKFLVAPGPDDRYYTTDFRALIPSARMVAACEGDERVAACLLFLALKSLLMPMLSAASRWGKTYPTIEPEDLKAMRVDEPIAKRCLARELVAKARRLQEVVEGSRRLELEYSSLLRA